MKKFGAIAIASILLGHFFISIGREETILELLRQSWYYSDLFYVSVISFCVVGYIALVHYSLDQRIPLPENFRARVLWQTLLGIVAPSLLALVLTLAYMKFVLGQDISDTTFFIYEFPISIVVIIAMNLVFMILTLMKPVTTTRTTMIVSKGEHSVPVAVDNIAAIAKEGDHSLVYTFDQEQSVSKETLENIMATLPSNLFFRANRQWIVHRSACGPFSTERSGKVNLTLKHPVGREITVSQKKGQEFKAWVGHTSA